MFYVFYVFFPLVYQQFSIKNHIWLVIRNVQMCFWCFFMSLCVFFSSFQFLNWFVFYVFFLPSPPNFSCYVFSVFYVFSFFLFQIAFSSIFSPCVFVMFFVLPDHQFCFFLLQKFHFFTPILCPFSFFPCLFSANPFFC